MKKLFAICISLFLYHGTAMAQAKGILLPYVIEKGDTIPIYTKSETLIANYVDGDMLKKQKYWARLLRNIRVVMPYAKVCSMKMEEIDRTMATLPKKERHKYLKTQEKELKKEFTAKLEDLTVDQGKLLIKLIDRETGHSSYSLVKEYKNGFSAFVWNGIASIFGMSLKEKYDPVDKDATIEYAIRALGYN